MEAKFNRDIKIKSLLHVPREGNFRQKILDIYKENTLEEIFNAIGLTKIKIRVDEAYEFVMRIISNRDN